jgi:hypothetical protein
MAAEIEIREVNGITTYPIRLGEVEADEGEPGIGQERSFTVVNTGTTIFLDVSVLVAGPGASRITLAVDRDGEPGVWTELGRSIALSDTLRPGESARFWAQARFASEDVELEYPFSFSIAAQSIATA